MWSEMSEPFFFLSEDFSLAFQGGCPLVDFRSQGSSRQICQKGLAMVELGLFGE